MVRAFDVSVKWFEYHVCSVCFVCYGWLLVGCYGVSIVMIFAVLGGGVLWIFVLVLGNGEGQ